MSPRLPLLALLGALAVMAAPPTPRPAPLATVQQRVDALLKHRLNPEPLPVDLPNPFQVVGGVSRDVAGERAGWKPAPEEPAAAVSTAPATSALLAPTAAEILGDCAARLKIGGIIIINGQRQIAINGILRKEGDTVAAEWDRAPIMLRIVHFVSGRVVVGYRDAELTVRF